MVSAVEVPVTREQMCDLIRLAQSDPVVSAFHKLVYDAAPLTLNGCRWMGVPLCKNPLDLWVTQELLWCLKPGLIVETGSWFGGSALFYAQLCDLIGRGEVISIDVEPPPTKWNHPRITWITGSSVDPAIVAQVRARAEATEGHVLVNLDSDHSPEHVAAELEAYAPLVTPRSYCIVEDTDCGGRPVMNERFAPRGGPYVAVQAFLETHPDWEADKLCEHYLVTHHPDGWLQRLR